jgi:UPF0042 nucleotide-binding protein
MKFTIKSAGSLHMDVIPEATLVFNVQDLAYDPDLKPELRELSGETKEIRTFVLNSPGVTNTIVWLVNLLLEFENMSIRPGVEELSLLVYCRGGRHRSRVIVDEVSRLLKNCTDTPVEVKHLHAHLPVVK